MGPAGSGTAMKRLSVPRALTAAAPQAAAAEQARQPATEGDEDFSVVIPSMQQMAGIPT
jgi:hypothetical protein